MLKINKLKKNYKDFSLECTCRVEKGRIVGLVGQNGAGKSTAFKAVLGLIRTDGGEISILGKDISTFTSADRENIGVVLSDSGFSGYLTVKDIISILKGLYKDFDKDEFCRRVEKFGLPLNKKIKEFSSGMKAKLKVLVALSHGASLLILDEPTAGLDVVARDELLMMLRDYMQESEERAILISSHISSDLETLCDEIYMIHGGKIILHEDTDVLLDKYGVLKLDEIQLTELDRRYISHVLREPYGIKCLTAERAYYAENYPSLVVERGSVDSVITMMIKGEKQ